MSYRAILYIFYYILLNIKREKLSYICESRLFQVSSRMKDQLLEASQMQGTILNSQKEGLRIQNELLDHGKELGTVLKSSSETVNNMVLDFK